MNFKVFLITLLSYFCMGAQISAQTKEEVTLTVSSDGPSKEDAVKNALRSAIEQAYGAFVSANTTILNDELVKDEIVTVSNGSIKEYKEISAIQTDNGKYFVTLSATVSLPNLITYAKSHGSECEFAGNTFGMEMKLFELQAKNEQKVLNTLLKQIEILIPQEMSWDLKLSEPIVDQNNPDYYKIQAEVYYHSNSDIDDETRLKRAGLHKDVLGYDEKALKKLKLNQGKTSLIEELRSTNRNRKHYFNSIDLLLYNTLSNISLPYSDIDIWGKRGVKIGYIAVINCDIPRLGEMTWFYLRSNAGTFESSLDSLIVAHAYNFVIKDNTGQTTDPNLLSPHILENWRFDEKNPVYCNVIKGPHDGKDPYSRMKGTGLLCYEYLLTSGYINGYYGRYNDMRHPYDSRHISSDSNRYLVKFDLIIPKEDIGKYSKFWIEPKN